MDKTDKIIKILLEKRGIKTEKEKHDFFNPQNPDSISLEEIGFNKDEVKKTVKRIKKAIKTGEKIIVYGDYDVDGITAVAILWETLWDLGANAMPYIPSRFTEGYGLNAESIASLKKEDKKIGLIITVDNGITANEKIDFANDLGIDVVITDHHQKGKTEPSAFSVIHTTKISGSAVAWFLAKELGDTKKDHMALSCLGTVSDVLPLLGFNRSFVFHGLPELQKTKRIGVQKLCLEAGINQKEIETYHIGFVLSPRFNAMGRLEHAMDSLRLLCTKNHKKAEDLAAKLGKTNKVRQEKTDFIFQHIEENFPNLSEKKDSKLLFFCHKKYEEGIVGIVAGRLAEKYYRPVIVGSIRDLKVKASARSIADVNIVELIKEAGHDLLLSFGGHQMAAGLTIKTENIQTFRKRLEDISQKLPDSLFVKKTKADCNLDFGLITYGLYKYLAQFAPFGFGNPQPLFSAKNVFTDNIRLVGRGNNHLQMSVSQKGSNNFRAIAFGMGGFYSKLEKNKPVEIIYSIEQDNWNGGKNLQLKVKEMKF